MIITIDGPSGAGKGTLATYLAHKYNLHHLDTGLLFRATACFVLEKKIDLNQEEDLVEIAKKISIKDFFVANLRTEEIANIASQIAKNPKIRQILTAYQRQFSSEYCSSYDGVILDGRDVGTVVLPDAPCKFFVTANLDIRTQRRMAELNIIEKGHPAMEKALNMRDQRDQTRDIAPLKVPEGAFYLDTTGLSIDEVCRLAENYVETIFKCHPR